MTDKHSLRDRAVSHCVGEAMGADGMPVDRLELPIAALLMSTLPEPAFARTIHLRPEAFFKRTLAGRVAMECRTTAGATATTVDLTKGNVAVKTEGERFRAVQTGKE